MPKRLSEIQFEEEQKSTSVGTPKRLSDIEFNEAGIVQKGVRKLSEVTTKALGEGMATGNFQEMTPLGKTLDIINRPSAAIKSGINQVIEETKDTQPGVSGVNVAKKAWAGLHGQERITANEMYKKIGVEGVPLLGFATEVALDPLTYVGGSLAKGLVNVGKQGATKVGTIGGKVVKEAAKRSPLINKTITKAADIGKVVKKSFVNTTGIPQLDDLVKKYSLQREAFKGDALEYGIKVRKVIENTAKKTGKSVDEISSEVVKLIEQPGSITSSSKEVEALANTLKTHFSNILTKEMKAGVSITALSENRRGIQYFPRITTNEAREYLRSAAKNPGMGGKVWNPKIANALKRKTGDFTLDEFNTFVKENGLESLGGRRVEEFFMKNPAYAATVRGQSSAKAVTSAEFIQEAGKTFGVDPKKAPALWEEMPESITKIYPQLKGKKYDPEVLGEIQRVHDSIFNPKSTGEVLKLYDNVLNYWKKWTLMPFSKYHIRNMVGNLWNNYLGGVVNPIVYAKATALQAYSKSKKEMYLKVVGLSKNQADDILKNAKNLGVTARHGQYYGDIPTAIEEAVKPTSWKSLSRYSPTKVGMKVGSTIENNARLAHFIDKLDKGIDANNAAISVKKFLFDYGDLTTFEKQVMKRMLPFYTWTRKNLPLQLEMLIKQPQKFIPITKMLANREEKNLLQLKYTNPELYDRMPVEIRRDADAVTYVPLEGLLPSADLANLQPRQAGQLFFDMLNPYVKASIELANGISFYRKRPLEKYPNQKEEFLRMELPVKMVYLMKTVLPQSRMLNQINKMVRKNQRKENLTPGEQVFEHNLSSVYKINLEDLKRKAMQTLYGKARDLENGYYWAKKNKRYLEMANIKVTLKKLKQELVRIK